MKRIYHIIALMALIGMFSVAGFGAFLYATGRLNAERIDQIAMVLRGESPQAVAPATQPATQPAPPAPQPSRAEIARMQAQREYYELAGERLRTEAEQRRMLNERVRLDITRQAEQEVVREQELAKQKALAETPPLVDPKEAQAKELEVFGSMDPKLARDLLRQRSEPEVIQLFMELDPNRVKKIVDACKTNEDRDWIGRILSQLHNMDSAKAGDVDGSTASSR